MACLNLSLKLLRTEPLIPWHYFILLIPMMIIFFYMPRQARKELGTGIYHVMLRGINRQDIFEDAEDYMRMLSFLQQMLRRG